MSVATDEHYPIRAGELPAGWELVYVGDAVSDVQSGFPSGKHNKDGVGVPQLRPYNIDREGRLDLSTLKHVPADAGDARIRIGDVLFNNTNSPELIGKTTAITARGEWAFSNHMTRLRLPEGILPNFVAYQLHYLWMCGYFRHRCTHHVNQASIASSALASTVPLVVAPTREQQRMVELIDEQQPRLDAAVAALKRVQANLKRYRASVLKAACEGRLVPTEAELAREEGRSYESASELLKRILQERRAKWEADQLARMTASGKSPKDNSWKKKYKEPELPNTANLPALPEGWLWIALGALADVIDPNPSHRTPKYVSDGVAFVSAENFVGDSAIDFAIGRQVGEDVLREQQERFSIAEGAFVMSRYGTIGKTCKIPSARTYCLSYSLVLIQSTSNEVDNEFLRFACSSELMSSLARSRVQGATIPDLGVAHIRLLPVAVCAGAEQRRICVELARRLSVLDRLGAEIETQLGRADRLRQAVLKHAFEGKLVPQDPNDEPASVLLERIRAEHAAAKPVIKKAARVRHEKRDAVGAGGTA